MLGEWLEGCAIGLDAPRLRALRRATSLSTKRRLPLVAHQRNTPVEVQFTQPGVSTIRAAPHNNSGWRDQRGRGCGFASGRLLGASCTPDGILQLEGDANLSLSWAHEAHPKPTLHGVVFQKLNGPLPREAATHKRQRRGGHNAAASANEGDTTKQAPYRRAEGARQRRPFKRAATRERAALGETIRGVAGAPRPA